MAALTSVRKTGILGACMVLCALALLAGCQTQPPAGDGGGCTNDAQCDDALYCNGAETCVDGECQAGTSPCAAGVTCDEENDVCLVCEADADCDDGNECTDDTCVDNACVNTNNMAECDDGDACTENDVCGNGVCAGTDVVCSNGLVCDPATGECEEVAECTTNGDCPDDGNFCTGDPVCVGGVCGFSGDPCAADEICDEDLNTCGPLAEPCIDDADCDDGLYCNSIEFCNSAGFCEDGALPCDAETETCAEGDTAAVCTPISGETHNFTLGVDDLPGTTGADTFLAAIELTGLGVQANTLQSGDAAEGLAGDDVLNAYLANGTGAALTIAPTLSGIETLNFNDYATANTITFNALNVTNATAVNLANGLNNVAQAFTVTGLGSVANVGITNSSEDFELVYQSSATASAADAMTLSLSNCNDGTLANRSEVKISSGAANGIETLTIDSAGATNRLLLLTQTPTAGTAATSLATLNVTGTHDLQIGDIVTAAGPLDNSITTVNANTFTGSLLEATVGNGIVAFTGGAGDDLIVYGANYTVADTIDGGDGIDFLGLTTAMTPVAVAQANVTNMEGLRVTDAHTQDVTLSRWGTGVNRVTLDAGANAGVLRYPAGTSYLNLGAFGTDAAGAGALTAIIVGSASGDVLNMTLNDADQTGLVTITGAETVNLTSNIDLDGSAASGGANAFAAAFTVTDGAGTQTLNVAGAAAITFDLAVTANVFNGADATGAITQTVASVGTSTVTGGSGADVLWGVNATGTAITGGGGADWLYGGDGGGANIFNGGDGADQFRLDDSVASGAPAAASVVGDWVDGVDFIGIDEGNTFGAGGAVGFAVAGGAASSMAATAAGATVLKSVAQNAAASAVGTGMFIKLTTPVVAAATDQLTFDAAIGTATVTALTAATSMAGSYYDTTNGQMVLFDVYAGAASTVVETADVIRVIARVGMSETDYTTNFTTADLLFY